MKRARARTGTRVLERQQIKYAPHREYLYMRGQKNSAEQAHYYIIYEAWKVPKMYTGTFELSLKPCEYESTIRHLVPCKPLNYRYV